MSPFVELSKDLKTGKVKIELVTQTENPKHIRWPPINRVVQRKDLLSTSVYVRPDELPEIEPDSFSRAAMQMQGFEPYEPPLKPLPPEYHSLLREKAIQKATEVFEKEKPLNTLWKT